ncbi:MAG: phytoene/squalene synthase family protein [Chthoniobacterales bacterium]
MSPPNSKELRTDVLRSVSRSFYLSIRVLPAPLRDPIALGYLLARATDTIADTTEIEPATRLQHLQTLAGLIQDGGNVEIARDLASSFAFLQSDDNERRLIEQLPGCLAWLDAMPAADRASVREVLVKINRGQTLDVERFAERAGVIALQTAAQLEEYTYLVAGSVGEFWTGLCASHLRDFASLPNERMRELGVAFGKGLQLINILRDAGEDLRAGRCYLPADELHAVGVNPPELRLDATAAAPVMERWRARAEEGIVAGIEYACAVNSWRVRLATALPALIGARTLALLKEAGPNELTQKVKVDRREVRRLLFAMITALASPRAIRREFARLSR